MSIFIVGCAGVGVAYALASDVWAHSRAARRRSWALRFIVALRTALEHLPQHRGMANAFLKGDQSFKDALTKLQDQIDTDLATLTGIAAASATHHARQGVATLAHAWKKLKAGVFEMQPEESFAAHTELVAELLYLMEDAHEDMHVEDGLDADGRLLANSLVRGIPVIAETIGQARGIGTGVAAQHACSVANRIKLKFLHKRIESVLEARLRNMQGVLSSALPASVAPGGIFDACVKSTHDFLASLRKDLIEADTIDVAPDHYYALGTRAIEANFRLFDTLAATVAASERTGN